jgi:hypothetical protein
MPLFVSCSLSCWQVITLTESFSSMLRMPPCWCIPPWLFTERPHKAACSGRTQAIVDCQCLPPAQGDLHVLLLWMEHDVPGGFRQQSSGLSHTRVEQRQSNGWKALDSLGSVERHAVVGKNQFTWFREVRARRKKEFFFSVRARPTRLQGMPFCLTCSLQGGTTSTRKKADCNVPSSSSPKQTPTGARGLPHSFLVCVASACAKIDHTA